MPSENPFDNNLTNPEQSIFMDLEAVFNYVSKLEIISNCVPGYFNSFAQEESFVIENAQKCWEIACQEHKNLEKSFEKTTSSGKININAEPFLARIKNLIRTKLYSDKDIEISGKGDFLTLRKIIYKYKIMNEPDAFDLVCSISEILDEDQFPKSAKGVYKNQNTEKLFIENLEYRQRVLKMVRNET